MALRDVIAERVLRERLCRRWTQENLADRAGYSASCIREIENATCDTRVQTIFDIAEALGINPKHLLGLK